MMCTHIIKANNHLPVLLEFPVSKTMGISILHIDQFLLKMHDIFNQFKWAYCLRKFQKEIHRKYLITYMIPLPLIITEKRNPQLSNLFTTSVWNELIGLK